MDATLPDVYQTRDNSAFNDPLKMLAHKGRVLSLSDPLNALKGSVIRADMNKRYIDENRLASKMMNSFSLVPNTANIERERANLLKKV